MIDKNFWNSWLKAESFQKFWDHHNNLFKQCGERSEEFLVTECSLTSSWWFLIQIWKKWELETYQLSQKKPFFKFNLCRYLRIKFDQKYFISTKNSPQQVWLLIFLTTLIFETVCFLKLGIIFVESYFLKLYIASIKCNTPLVYRALK